MPIYHCTVNPMGIIGQNFVSHFFFFKNESANLMFELLYFKSRYKKVNAISKFKSAVTTLLLSLIIFYLTNVWMKIGQNFHHHLFVCF